MEAAMPQDQLTRLGDTLSAHPNELRALFSRFVRQGKGMLQPHQLLSEFEAAFLEGEKQQLKNGVFWEAVRAAQEAVVLPPWVALAVRPRPGVCEYIRVNVNELAVEELSEAEYHQFKEEHISSDHVALVINQEHFDASSPRPSLPDQRGEVIICVSASNPPPARPDGGMRGGTESPITCQVFDGVLLTVAFNLLAAKPEQQAGIPFLMDLYTASILVTVFTGILLIALHAVAAERAPPRLLAWARAVDITSLIMVAVLRLCLETSTPSLIRSVLLFIAMLSVAMAPPLLSWMFRRVFCTK